MEFDGEDPVHGQRGESPVIIVLIVLAFVCVATLLYGLHRLATWAEDRGWIYYRKGRGSAGAGARATLELQSLAHPSTRHVIEERRRSELERVDDQTSSGRRPSHREAG
jgi:hypothetical protein